MTIDYTPAIPRKSATIIGCWVSMHLPGGFIDFKWLLKDDIERLAKYSEKGMGGTANALYKSNNGQIDAGFLEAKTIKHAMRTCPKLRTSDVVSFDGEEEYAAAEVTGSTFDVPSAPATDGAAEPQSFVVQSDGDEDLF